MKIVLFVCCFFVMFTGATAGPDDCHPRKYHTCYVYRTNDDVKNGPKCEHVRYDLTYQIRYGNAAWIVNGTFSKEKFIDVSNSINIYGHYKHNYPNWFYLRQYRQFEVNGSISIQTKDKCVTVTYNATGMYERTCTDTTIPDIHMCTPIFGACSVSRPDLVYGLLKGTVGMEHSVAECLDSCMRLTLTGFCYGVVFSPEKSTCLFLTGVSVGKFALPYQFTKGDTIIMREGREISILAKRQDFDPRNEIIAAAKRGDYSLKTPNPGDLKIRLSETYEHPAVMGLFEKLDVSRIVVSFGIPHAFKRIVFNGKNSNKTSWFTKDRLLASPWRDLYPMTDEAFFRNQSAITSSPSACDSKTGWFMATNNMCSQDSCNQPRFMYSGTRKSVNWKSDDVKVARTQLVNVVVNVRCNDNDDSAVFKKFAIN